MNFVFRAISTADPKLPIVQVKNNIKRAPGPGPQDGNQLIDWLMNRTRLHVSLVTSPSSLYIYSVWQHANHKQIEDQPDCTFAGYEWKLVIKGHWPREWCRWNDVCRLRIKAKVQSKYVHISCMDVFTINCYSIQHHCLCLIYNFVSMAFLKLRWHQKSLESWDDFSSHWI